MLTRFAAMGLVAIIFTACAADDQATVAIEEAKEVIASHEQFARAGDLEGIVGNAAEDLVVIAAGAPLIEGREAFRAFYDDLLQMGVWEFSHDYMGAVYVGGLVNLHGVARGTVTPTGQAPVPFENNFLLVLRPDPQGMWKVWRSAFAPANAQ